MKRVGVLGCAMLAACGSTAPPAEVPQSRPTEPEHHEATPSESVAETVPTEANAPRALLGGRFEITLPPGLVLEPSQAWGLSDELRVFYDAYEFNMQECTLTLAVRSHGLVRPREVPLREGETRLLVPSEASPHLEVITTHSRPFDVLGLTYAALGAAVFEPDGTATDIFLWPHLALGEESVEPENVEWGTDAWFAAQRNDPRLARCYEAGENLLHTALPTLVARRPFAPVQTQFYFGYDIDMDAEIAFAGTIPDGWVITSEAAYDARFDDLHRRLPWAWIAPNAETRARVWMFSGLWPDDIPRPRMGPRRAHLFDHDLRFDRGQDGDDDGSCARVEERSLGLTHTVCLRGTRAEQDELVAILRTFQRVQGAGNAASPGAPQTCVTRIHDADGQTNVRALASSRSEVVGTIPSETTIAPVEQRGRWLRITTPQAGWVFADNVERRCE